jgi:hypothetical protein
VKNICRFVLFRLTSFCMVLPLLFVPAVFSPAQRAPDAATLRAQREDKELPLRRIALFSSGIAHFQRSGTIVSGTGTQTHITLSVEADAVNDVLKSLVINDPASTAPSVQYAAENALWRTLRSLSIDLSGMPGTAEILNSLRGAELEVSAPSPIRGRIIGVENRQDSATIAMHGHGFQAQNTAWESWLSLFTAQGIRLIPVRDITSFRFIDEAINADLNHALDILLNSRDSGTRDLVVTLDGSGSRTVSLSYILPAPVWKAAYRLDLSGNAPFLQGWAIVDNDSDADWNEVELSLVIGRPVSFVQNLFHPYHVFRPMLPLTIAGAAEARLHDPGMFGGHRLMMRQQAIADAEMAVETWAVPQAAAAMAAPALAAPPLLTPGLIETADGAAAGEQFLFTLPNPVTLNRRQSAMLPLVEGSVQAERTLVFSGASAAPGATIHPQLAAEITNSLGMRLPAGPITVYDGGIFAGSAIIGFLAEDERRLITFGDDLSVSGNVSLASSNHISSVSISGGVMTISRRQSHERVYTIRNAHNEQRRIIIEHPITHGAQLVMPQTADDQTAALYRFNRTLGAHETLVFTVREETPLYQSVTLAHLHPETFFAFAASEEIPASVRVILNQAITLHRIALDAETAQQQLEAQRRWIIEEQGRVRNNIEVIGTESPHGQEFLNRLIALDNDIAAFNARVQEAALETWRARQAFESFLATINI